MPAKRKPFIVLTLGDRESYGFDEQVLEALVALMDAARPDYRNWHHAAVTGYFVASARSFRRVEGIVRRAEKLRSSDARFECLGIGLSAGEMIAEFTWLGRVNSTGGIPLGAASSVAAQLAIGSSDAYRTSLNRLRDEYCRA